MSEVAVTHADRVEWSDRRSERNPRVKAEDKKRLYESLDAVAARLDETQLGRLRRLLVAQRRPECLPPSNRWLALRLSPAADDPAWHEHVRWLQDIAAALGPPVDVEELRESLRRARTRDGQSVVDLWVREREL